MEELITKLNIAKHEIQNAITFGIQAKGKGLDSNDVLHLVNLRNQIEATISNFQQR